MQIDHDMSIVCYIYVCVSSNLWPIHSRKNSYLQPTDFHSIPILPTLSYSTFLPWMVHAILTPFRNWFRWTPAPLPKAPRIMCTISAPGKCENLGVPKKP